MSEFETPADRANAPAPTSAAGPGTPPNPADPANPSSPPNRESAAQPAAPTSPSRARWIIAGAAGVAIALFAMPLLIGGPSRAGDPPVATAGTCAAKATPAKLDFTVKDMHGADVRIADYKGKVILLNYWATWCGPCKVEIPDLIALYDEYKDKGLVVLGVSQDDDPETLRSFASTFKMNYPILVGRDQPDLLDAQGPLWGLPTSYLISRDGSVCTRHLGPATKETFEREIKPLL